MLRVSSRVGLVLGLFSALACQSAAEVAPEPVAVAAAQRSTPPPASHVATPVTPVEVAPPEPSAAAPKPLGPLPAPVLEKLAAVRPDPAPAELVRDTHYWASNEHGHWRWHDDVAGLGGAYLGVATDQNYLLAGWSRPELIVLLDFDAAIVDLHGVYAVFFAAAASPDEFLALWEREHKERAEQLLAEAVAPERAAVLQRTYRRARPMVRERLQGDCERNRERGLATPWTDQATYDYIRELSRNGRIFAVRGDLKGKQAVLDVGAAIEAAGLELNVIYLSNAEQYLHYVPRLRRNFANMPIGERAVVLRTHGWRQFGYVQGEEYHYNVQTGPSWVAWLTTTDVASAAEMLERREKSETRGESRLDDIPEPSPRPPKIAE